MRKQRKASGYNTRPDRNAGRALSDIAAQPIVWVIPGLVPRDALTLLLGNPGCGKSLLTQTWAGDVSQQGMNTLLLSAEDVPESVLVPRFTACQADTRRIFIPTQPLTLPARMPYLRALVVQHNPGLLVLDLLDSFSTLSLSHAGNTHTILGELIGLARHYHLGVVGVVHEGKTGKRDLHRILGSVELAGMARSVIVVEDDAQGRKCLRQIKCNVAPLHHPISFRIESVAVGQGIDAPRIVFDHGAEREAHQVPVHKTCMNAEDFTIERGKDGSTLQASMHLPGWYHALAAGVADASRRPAAPRGFSPRGAGKGPSRRNLKGQAMYDLRRVDLRPLFAMINVQKGRTVQKFIRNSYVICQDEDFAIEEHDDGTYDLVLQVVRADGDGVRAELVVSMTAIELAKLGEHIEETTAGMETALVRQQEHVERTLDYLRHRHHDNGNGEGTGRAPRR